MHEEPSGNSLSSYFQRMPSKSASQEDLAFGATQVMPLEHLVADGLLTSDKVATKMEVVLDAGAGRGLEDGTASFKDLSAPPVTAVVDGYAFAFDIDGVLVRGGAPIPEAAEAMRILNGENEYGVKVPYIFVTNGGGKTEKERCLSLSKQLDMEVSPGQFICGNTPMREMAKRYHTVLVVGGENETCRHVAGGYGFKDIVTPGDIIKYNSNTTPFRKLTEDEDKHSRTRNFGETEIEAIFVFTDSHDWGGDQQIILDLLMSKNGRLGTRSESFNEGPPIFFPNNDVVSSTSHPLTRIGMGALRASLEAIFKAMTGKELHTTAYGKPQTDTFECATRLLQQWRKDKHGIECPPRTVYFVGDTPESDIHGTNEFDKKADNGWFSILVGTGIFEKGTKPRYAPKKTVNTVLDAVRFGMNREHAKPQQRTCASNCHY